MKKKIALFMVVIMGIALLVGCSGGPVTDDNEDSGTGTPTQIAYDDGYEKNVMRIAGATEIETADVQLTTEDYMVPQNIYDTLVTVKATEGGSSELVPSLAEKWEISADGLTYTFHLRDGVLFHNGETLEADDVLYTIDRMLNPARLAKNTDCMNMIAGAQDMLDGKATTIAGVGLNIIDNLTFEIVLEQAYAPFLANCCVPGFSIYNREAGELADKEGGGITGSLLGVDPKFTVGTGPFMLKEWVLNDHIYLETFKDYWGGASAIDGILRFVVADNDTRRMMFDAGKIDMLDLDDSREQIEYYQNLTDWNGYLVEAPRLGTYYYSINESIEPFNNVLVRKAMQMAIDRQAILDSMYYGKGTVANGIFPPGLVGYNAKLPAIEYNVEQAKALLKEAGYPDGFDMVISQSTDSPSTLAINEIVQAQFGEIGINVKIEQMDEATWFDVRRTGELGMYMSSWSADFNDPDNFIYTFFNPTGTVTRSFNYTNAEAMERIVNARYIVDVDERIAEYQALEKLVIQDDAAWLPLFNLEHVFAFNSRVQNYVPHWAGWSDSRYWSVSLDG
ncbi:MAG: ABC transporter substrate-binding protein [Clostridia bacterium]